MKKNFFGIVILLVAVSSAFGISAFGDTKFQVGDQIVLELAGDLAIPMEERLVLLCKNNPQLYNAGYFRSIGIEATRYDRYIPSGEKLYLELETIDINGATRPQFQFRNMVPNSALPNLYVSIIDSQPDTLAGLKASFGKCTDVKFVEFNPKELENPVITH